MTESYVSRCAILTLLLLGIQAPRMFGQADPNAGATAEPTQSNPRDTFFEHPNDTKWWISGQANFVFQAHGGFYAQYSGPNSLKIPKRTRSLGS